MDQSATVIAIYYYDGYFYLPACVRSLAGLLSITEPITIIPVNDRAALAEEIELKAAAGNATLSNADFRAASENSLQAAMHLPNRLAFLTKTRRWSLVEENGAYTLIPFKPAPLRGVVEDMEQAIVLDPATFAIEASELLHAQLGQ